MNDKSKFLMHLVNVVVECCATQIDEEGTMSITKDQLLGKRKCKNLVMSRSLLASLIQFAGYTPETTALLLHTSVQSVRHLLDLSQEYHKDSRAYKIAEAEALLKIRDVI